MTQLSPRVSLSNLYSSEVICNATEGYSLADFLHTCTHNCREQSDKFRESSKIMASECDITSEWYRMKYVKSTCTYLKLQLMSQNIITIWRIIFGKSPVICQIRQSFPMPNICTIWHFIHSWCLNSCTETQLHNSKLDQNHFNQIPFDTEYQAENSSVMLPIPIPIYIRRHMVTIVSIQVHKQRVLSDNLSDLIRYGFLATISQTFNCLYSKMSKVT